MPEEFTLGLSLNTGKLIMTDLQRCVFDELCFLILCYAEPSIFFILTMYSRPIAPKMVFGHKQKSHAKCLNVVVALQVAPANTIFVVKYCT